MAKSRSSSAPKRNVFSSSGASKPKSAAGGSKKANNVSGFAHRQAQRNPQLDENPLEVFDLVTQKHKRSNVDSALSRDEAGTGKGRASRPKDEDEMGGEEDVDEVRERIRKLVNGEEVGLVEDDDDEEVESDDAWEEGGHDQNSWGGAFLTNTKKAKSQNARKPSAIREINLDEDSDVDLPPTTKSKASSKRSQFDDEDQDDDFDSDEGGSEGFFDLSTMLDRRTASDDERQDAEGADDDEMDEDSEEDEDDGMSEDEDEEEGGDLDRLGNYISALQNGKRKAEDEDEGAGSRSKRRVLKDRGEDGRKEGEFGAPLNKSTKLSLNELLQPLPQNSSTSLLKSAKALAPAPLAAPLPTRAQDKLDRSAAYEATKEEVEKWGPAMKRIKEAEHLSFPLQAHKAPAPSSSALVAKFKPSNDLESAVANLLNSAQMTEKDIEATESLAMNNLTIEEVAARRAELSRMRELMFRAEAKNKRVAKIKSKAYRKIAKKEREKNAQKIEEAGFNLDADPEEAQLEQERKRATERATLRHKNTGKWAKSMLGRAELDVDQRRELNEQLEQGDRLKKKIQNYGEDGEDDDSSSEEEGDDIDAVRQRAFDDLEALDGEDAVAGGAAGGGKKKKEGLFEMKFMQDGMARAQAGADRDANDLRREFGGGRGEDEEDEDLGARPAYTTVDGNRGRQVYGQTTVPSGNPAAPPSDASSSTLKSSLESAPQPSANPYSQLPSLRNSAPTAPAESNPWLTAADATAGSKRSKKKNIVTGGKEAVGAEKAAVALKKGLARTEEAREAERDDAEVEIELDQSNGAFIEATTVTAGSSMASSSTAKAKGKAPKSTAKPIGGDDESDEEEDDEAPSHGPLAIRQRDLVAQAFAGDNVIEDFAAEKRREEEADAPREQDLTLPGWGAWGGKGVKKSKKNPPKKFTKKIAGIEVAKRHDFGKSNVIISERKDKKAQKYTTKDLPYPYTSVAQYEASLSQPMGTEWQTRGSFQKLTLPKVSKKMGAVIHPLEKQF